jgi:hypothetical protein
VQFTGHTQIGAFVYGTDTIAEMAYRLGIQTAALQGLFRMLGQDLPKPDEIFLRLAELIDTQQEIQQQLTSLRKRYLRLISQDTALERLLNIIRDRQLELLNIAHPTGHFISGEITTKLGDNPAIVQIMNMLSWQSLSGRACKTQLTSSCCITKRTPRV